MTITSLTIYTAWLIFGVGLVSWLACCSVNARHRTDEEDRLDLRENVDRGELDCIDRMYLESELGPGR